MSDAAQQSSLASEAYSVVRQRILSGTIGLGQVISRRKLAAELRMSFLPVSEALLRLEVEGLLESRPRAGTRVRIPSAEDVQGHYVVREALEVQAARLFAVIATEDDRNEVRRLAVRVDALDGSDHSLYLPAHEKLHHRIAESTRCAALSMAIEKIHALGSTWFCVGRTNSDEAAIRRHQDLVDVLVSGTPDEAAEAMRQHVNHGLENAMARLKPYFRIRKVFGRTYFRSEKRQKQQLVLPTALN